MGTVSAFEKRLRLAEDRHVASTEPERRQAEWRAFRTEVSVIAFYVGDLRPNEHQHPLDAFARALGYDDEDELSSEAIHAPERCRARIEDASRRLDVLDRGWDELVAGLPQVCTSWIDGHDPPRRFDQRRIVTQYERDKKRAAERRAAEEREAGHSDGDRSWQQ
jgi:hypothetical protein